MKRQFPWTMALVAGFLASCSTIPSGSFSVAKVHHLKMKSAPPIGQTLSGQTVLLGGFSGLVYKGVKNNDEFIFETITDRGPSGPLTSNKERPFLLPDFSPQIVTLKANLKDSSLITGEIVTIKKKNGSPSSGLPNKRDEENPVDVSGFMYSVDSSGLDSESLVYDGEGGYWVAEEYGPSLIHVANDGKMIRRLLPFYELPKVYAEKKSNRGFEGVAKEKNKIFGFLQSPLPADPNFARIAEVDLETLKTSGEYYYGLEKNMEKIGDATNIGQNKFLVIEQNGKKGSDSRKYVFKITLNGNDQLVKKELLIDLGETAFATLEKVEGVALIDSRRIALVNDNDFQINSETDFKTGITPLNSDPNEMLILEFKEDITQ